jgi:hypothetical protein
VKLGAESRTKLTIAVALLAVAVILGARFVGSLGGGSSSAAAPVATNGASSIPETPALRTTTKRQNTGKKPASVRSLDPTLRYDLLKASEETKYEGAGRNIFRAFVAPPPPVIASVATDHPPAGPQLPSPPPPPPPIDLKFYGFAISKPGEAKRIFLISHGEDVFIAKEGDIVDRRYKVVRISPNAVEILDVLSNNRQSIPLTQG